MPPGTSDLPTPPPPKGRLLGGIRLRLLALILVTQALMVWWTSDSEIARGIYLICYSLMMPTALYILLARLLRRWLPFEDRELLLGYIVLTATLPIVGFSLRFIITGAGYLVHFSETMPVWLPYAGLLEKLPHYPLLHDLTAIHNLYLGNAPVPWSAWAWLIAFWSAYMLLMAGLWICLAVVLRRIWIHQERLAFPVAMIPIQLLDPRNDIFRRPLFWLGFAIPAVLQSLLAINYLVPAVPAFQLKGYNVWPLLFQTRPWNAVPDLMVGFYPMAVGLAYFVPSNVSFSCWFFALASKLSFVVFAAMGFESLGVMGVFPYTQEQGVGAWLAFAGLIVWGARRQWRSAVHAVAAEEQRAVRRLAVLGGALMVACIGMMSMLGVSPLIAGGMVLVYVAYVLSGARVRAEAGNIWTFAPLITPFRVTSTVLGTTAMGPQGVLTGGTTDLVHVDIRAQSLPYLLEGLDIAEKTGIPWRTVALWVAIGSVTALALGWWRTLADTYAVGAATAKANQYPLIKAMINYRDLDNLAATGTEYHRGSVMAMVVGAAITLFLAWSRRVGILGLHPVGYVIANTITINAFIFCFFIAWAAKSLVLRFGGDKAYRKSVPFFVGVTLGDIVIQAAWALAGWVFDMPIYQFLT